MENKSHDSKSPSFWKQVIEFFFPPACAVCRTCGYTPLCPDCLAALEEVFEPKRFLAHEGNGFADEMIGLFPYKNPRVKRLIFSYKVENLTENRAVFRCFLKKAIGKKVFRNGIDLVTFAPRRKRARRTAGFDQAEELSRIVAEEMELPWETLLARTGRSRRQRKLNSDRRRKNVFGVFSPLRPLHGETVLLVDDVVTSGATVWECARVLKKAGAHKVYVLCYARSGGKVLS